MTHSQDQIGIGFIGAGDVSLLHAEAVRRCPSAKLAGLWNRSRDRAAERAASFQCKTYSTPEALVSDPALHAVFVLTNLERSEEHTSELQSHVNLVCRLLLEKKKHTPNLS